MPHQFVTGALVDRMAGQIRRVGRYTSMIRERGMIPVLSTHMPDTVVYADKAEADVETDLQIFNAYGFLMQVEVDWASRVIQMAMKPVLIIKPLASGQLPPFGGLTFVWNSIRE